MSEEASVSKLVADMASMNVETRLKAATELYRRGTELGTAATGPWLRDTELAELLSHSGKAEFPSLSATVGIAVLPGNFVRIRAMHGSQRLANVPPDQDALEFELKFEGGIHLDILTTKAVAGSGAIARYLAKFGEGIQQIEYLTSSVDRATAILRQRFSQESIYPATRSGAANTLVNFFLAAAPDGKKVLIELVELPAPK